MLEINKKEDIIIPFDKIGDKNWKLKTSLIIESIAENWENELQEPISENEINKLEERLGTSLPEGLKLFYTSFGVANIGEELQSLDEIDWLKKNWYETDHYIPEFTKEEKKLFPSLISFSNYLGNGNIFCFHSETKEIYYFDHDSEPYLSKLFDTVDEYLKACLVFYQADLFGEVEQESVEEWTEDIVSGIVGKEIVRKWQY